MSEFMKIVPKPARILANSVLYLAVLGGAFALVFQAMHLDHLSPTGAAARIAMGALLGVVVGVWILCLGYVYGDAGRRTMPPVLWTLVAALGPNLLGFLLYFALRRPVAAPCARCARPVAADQRYCSWCGYEMAVYPPIPPAPPDLDAHPVI